MEVVILNCFFKSLLSIVFAFQYLPFLLFPLPFISISPFFLYDKVYCHQVCICRSVCVHMCVIREAETGKPWPLCTSDPSKSM